jgi:iron(III)-enterobactin esterase
MSRLRFLCFCLFGCGAVISEGPNLKKDAGTFEESRSDAGLMDSGFLPPISPGDAGGSDAAVLFDAGVAIPDAGDSGTAMPDAGIDVGTEGDGKFDIGPNYTADPNFNAKAGVPKGKIYAFQMDANRSTIFRGNFMRNVWVYVPKQYVNGTAAPLMVVQDGVYQYSSLSVVLDNLISQRKLPAMVVIFINPGDANGAQRNLEYDRVSDDYVRFIETEVLPQILSNSAIKADYPQLSVTSNPEGRAALGCSSGAAAAFTMAWFRPDLYHRVVSYSGTFVAQFNTPQYPLGAWEYHARVIAQTPQKPLRVFLEVGENDLNLNAERGNMYNDWVKANRDMFSALNAKGYHTRFLFAKAQGHCDDKQYRQELPNSLVWVWRGYPIP